MLDVPRQDAPAEVSTSANFRSAYVRTAAARAALASSELLPINLDVVAIVTTVLGALPEIRALRQQFASLPNLDLAAVDALPDYAEALAFAQGALLAASGPRDPLPELLERATPLRSQLLWDAATLARRGLLDGQCLAKLKGGGGYLKIGTDLGVLVRMFRSSWSSISGKSAVERTELEEAERLFEAITLAVARRAHKPAAVAEAADQRQRAYTLLLRAYDQARRAVSYVRWNEKDADQLTPSLWSGRKRGAKGQLAARALASATLGLAQAKEDAAVPQNAARELGARPGVDVEAPHLPQVALAAAAEPVRDRRRRRAKRRKRRRYSAVRRFSRATPTAPGRGVCGRTVLVWPEEERGP